MPNNWLIIILCVIVMFQISACENRIIPEGNTISEITSTREYLGNIRRDINKLKEKEKENNANYTTTKQLKEFDPKVNTVGTILKNDWHEMPLSSGDRVRIIVDEGEHFSGVFEVSVDGYLHIPFVKPIKADGVSTQKIEKTLKYRLEKEGMFRIGLARVSVSILRWAEILINVSGAVFNPGRHYLNVRNTSDKLHNENQKTGHNPFNRFLTSALKGAGGIRPDADLSKIKLMRNGKEAIFDVSGIFTGKDVEDIPLQSHDRIIVPSLGFEQVNLIRPSQITPPGFQVYLSNLTVPAAGNALSAIGTRARTLPYGARLLQGLMAANCVGGARSTNAERSAVLVSKNFMTGDLKVIERPIETLVQHANREEYNPYLMPDDGIACYDSTATNIREIASMIKEILQSFNLIKLLFI